MGTWLVKELSSNGHEVVAAPAPELLDIADRAALKRWLAGPGGPPDAVVHLAGMAFAPEADLDPAEAIRVNVGGTIALFEALRENGVLPPVLVSGSADVYGMASPDDLPLREEAPLATNTSYGLSKLAQEAVAVEASVRYGFPVVVARSFNHTGPGQRPVFVVPAMARRVMAVKRGEAAAIPAGNVHRRRDLTDVRDVVVAYRLLLEASVRGALPTGHTIVNVASGEAVSVRSVIDRLCSLVGVTPKVEIDQALIRVSDPPEIRGDAALLHRLVGWQPLIPLDQTLVDILATV